MDHGRVEGIFISARKGEFPQPVERARAVAGRGLEGNRYFFDEAPPGQAITLIAAEALAEGAAESGVDLGAAESRRNVLTSGIDLNALVGKSASASATSSASASSSASRAPRSRA